jgi:hypothetical protein
MSVEEAVSRAAEETGLKITPEIVEQARIIIESLNDPPTNYFEAKLMRGVDFGEFVGVAIPSHTSAEAKKFLESKGLTIQEYSIDMKNATIYNLIEKLNSARADAIRKLTKALNQEYEVFFQGAYHGTPHRGIEKMYLQKIGTGEGAQVYGWGIYSAESKDLAEWYRRRLAGRQLRDSSGNPTPLLTEKKFDGKTLSEWHKYWQEKSEKEYEKGKKKGTLEDFSSEERKLQFFYGAHMEIVFNLLQYPGDLDAAIKFTNEYYSEEPEAIQWAEKTFRTELNNMAQGQVYKLDIPESNVLLDWDKPLSEQPEKVRKALRRGDGEFLGEVLRNLHIEDPTGESLYRMIQRDQGSDKAASLYLNSLGIPGLRYLDANSRDDGKGTHNFVIWNEDAMKIMETYYQLESPGGLTYGENLRQDEQKWGQEVDKLQASGTPTGQHIKVMTTPLAFHLAGAKALPVYMDDTKLFEILKDHPGMTWDLLKQIPGALTDPIAVFASKTVPNSLVAMLELTDENGATVVGALHLDYTQHGYTVNKLASVYGKDDISTTPPTPRNEWFIEELTSNRLRYLDTKKISRWLPDTGLRLPQGLENGTFLPLTIESLSQSVPTEADLVNLRETYDGRYQGDAEDPRARIEFTPEGKSIITLFSGRDASSLFHEFGHKILYDFARLGGREGVSAQYRQDAQTTFKYLGTTAEEFGAMRDEIRALRGATDEARLRRLEELTARVSDIHEKFAKSFEVYLSEGKAPSKEMRGVFARLKQWMIQVYHDAAKVLGVDLSPEIREVFDRLLATPDDITKEYEAQTKIGELAAESVILRERIAEYEAEINAAYREGFREGRENEEQQARERLAKLKEKQKARATLKTELNRLIKGINRMADSGNIIYTMQQKIRKKLADYDLKKRKKSTLDRRAELEEYLKASPEAGDTMNPEDLKHLGATTLNDMTIEDVRQLEAEVSGMYEQGRREYVEWEAANAQRVDKTFSDFHRALQKTKPVVAEIITGPKDIGKQYRGIRGALARLKDWNYANNLGIVRFFNWLDGNTMKVKEKQGAFTENFVNTMNAAEDTKLRHVFERRRWMEDHLKELGLKFSDFSKVRVRDVLGKNWTVDEIMHLYIGMKNEKNRAAIVSGNFGKNMRMEQALQVINSLVSSLTEDEKRAAELVPRDHDRNFERLNNALVEVFNKGMEKEENYVSMHRLGMDTERGVIEDADAMAAAGDDINSVLMRKVEDKFMISRVNISDSKQTPIMLGLFSGWHSDMNTHEHSAAFAAPAVNISKALLKQNPAERKNVAGMVRDRFGADALKTLFNFFNVAINDNKFVSHGMFDKAANFLARRQAIAYLAGNLGTVMRQFTSIPRFMTGVGPGRLMEAAWEIAANGLKSVYESDPQMRDREGSPILKALKEQRGLVTGHYANVLDAMFAPISYADRLIAAIGWKAMYNASVKELGHEGAVRKAQRFISATQQTARAKDTTKLWRENGLVRLAMIFTSDAAQTFGMTAYDFARQVTHGEVGAAMRTLTALTLTGMLVAFSRGELPWDEEDDEVGAGGIGWWMTDFMTDEFVQSIPLVGKELMAIYDSYVKGKNYPRYSALGTPVEKVFRAIKLIRKDDEMDEEQKLKCAGYLMEAASLTIVPAPSTAIRRVWDAVNAFKEEEDIAQSVKIILGIRGGN